MLDCSRYYNRLRCKAAAAAGVREMSKTIYVVTSGSYSDYGILAVFDDRALADEFVKRRNEGPHYEDAGIEEWELNPSGEALRKGMAHYAVWLKEWEAVDIDDIRVTSAELSKPTEYQWTRGKSVQMVVIAKDVEHAAKIGTEKRMIWMTQGIEAIGGEKFKPAQVTSII